VNIVEYTNAKDILAKGSELRHKRFREIGCYERLNAKGNKGGLGHFIEEVHFGYQINSSKLADFNEANIELKVTPIKRNKNKSYSAKERLVLNIIDFHSEYQKTFQSSSFWSKNQTLLLVFYLFDEALNREDYKIEDVFLFDYPDEDLEIIKQDWKYIVNKIKQGEAHTISEGQTMYLGACPKGANRQSSMVSQPFSDKLAMRRAFSLKQSYMTQIVRDYVKGNKKHPNIIKTPGEIDKKEKTPISSKPEQLIKQTSDLKSKGFEDVIEEKIYPFVGKRLSTLKKQFDIENGSKSLNMQLLNKMFGVKGNLRNTSEFKKANIVPKTIRINKNNHIKESMSFPKFTFKEIIQEPWMTSHTRNLFESQRFMFTVFKEIDDDYIFKGIQFWSMLVKDIETHVKDAWETTVDIISNGSIVASVDKHGKRKTNFPTQKDNPVTHVRPHAQNASDTEPLPVKDQLTGLQEYTKHCFWLNNHYILKQLDDKFFE